MLKSSKNSVLKILMMSSEFIYVVRSYIWTWTQCSMPLALQLGVLESSQKRWCWSPVISTTCTHTASRMGSSLWPGEASIPAVWRLHPVWEVGSLECAVPASICCPTVVMKAAVLWWVLQCVLDSKWHPKPVVLRNGIQIDRSAAKSMLGMETSSRPFKFGDSGAQPRSSVCNRAMALQNSAPDTFGHNEQV